MNEIKVTFGIASVIVGSVVFLALFFNATAWFRRKSSTSRAIRLVLKGILDDRTRVTVHVASSDVHSDVRILGFTGMDACGGPPAPFELSRLIVLEYPDGRRVLFPAKLVRMIEVPQTGG